jgi:1-acyl-sn-glycerol-3-phosphate acyltransferase
MRHLRAAWHAVYVVLIMTAGILLLPHLSPARYVAFKRWMCQQAMGLFGIRLTVEGQFIDGPALIVSNHCSYIDIFIMQATGEVRFTPKAEIRSWPLIGALTTAFGSIYVDRTPGRTREVTEMLLAKLRQGLRICVFPEATTNDGRTLKPFKSSLFALAEAWDGPEPLPVQPVTIRYERLGGHPLDDATWPQVAWYGEATLVDHLWRAFSHRGLEVRVICHPPVTLSPGRTRKDLAQESERAIAQTLFLPSQDAA